MGKRKTKNKIARGYVTTSTQSLTEKMGLTSIREQQIQEAEAANKQKVAASSGMKPIGEDSTADDIMGVSDETQISEAEAEALAAAQLPWVANPIPKEFDPVFAGRKRIQKLRGNPLRGNEAQLTVKPSLEDEALKVLAEIGDLNPEKNLWHGDTSDPRVRSRMLANLLELEGLGFTLNDIKSALQHSGPDIDAALEWLSLYLDESSLPPGWVQERPRKNLDRRELEVMVNQTGSQTPISAPEPPIAESQTNEDEQAEIKARQEAEKAEAKKKDEDAKRLAARDASRNHILRMYEMQQEEEEAREAELRATQQAAKEELKLPPLERGRRLNARMESLRKQAADADDMGEKRSLGRDIQNTKAQIQALMKQYPEIAGALAAAQKQVKQEQKTMKDQVKEGGIEFANNPNTKSNDAKEDGVMAEDSHEGNGADEIEDADASEIFADLFAESEEVDGPSRLNGGNGDAKPTYDKVDIGPLRGGLEPCRLLEQHARRIFSKQVKVKFAPQQPPVSHMFSSSVTFARRHYEMPVNECCESKRMAQNYVSMIALYDLAADMSYNMQMPVECQDLWNKWKLRDEHARLAAEHEVKLNKIAIVDDALKGLTPENTGKEQDGEAQASVSTPTVVDDWSTGFTDSGTTKREQDHAEENARLKEEFSLRVQTDAYARMAEERASLPVLTIEADLIRCLEHSDVVIVSGQTGSGKTTQIPHLMLAHEMQSGRGALCNIACCEPRRISAVSVAERVSEEMADSKIGASDSYVGYQIRGERRAGSSCRVLYCTTGILLAQLRSDPMLLSYSHIVVDEVHERTVDSDFLLVVLRKIVRERGESSEHPLKVVLMSATIDLDKLANYFGGAPVLEAGGRTFPVTRFALEDAIQLTGYTCELESEYCRRDADQRETYTARMGQGSVTWSESQQGAVDYAGLTELDPTIYHENTTRTVYRLDQTRVNLDLIESLLMLLTDPDWRLPNGVAQDSAETRFQDALNALHDFPDARAGAILVFLPGLAQITNLYNRLTHGRYFGNSSRFLVLRLHSSLSSLKDEQRKVFETPRRGVVKIVLSTNIAETGVTIPDVVYTIDTARVKQVGFNPARQMQSLEDTFVSRASLTQRAGRAGRVKPGIAFQLISTQGQREWLSDFQMPEIRRVALEGVCLQIMAMHAGGQEDERLADPWRFLREALDPPLPKAIHAAMQNLVEAGAVIMKVSDTDTNNQGKNTDHTNGRGNDLPDLLRGQALLTPLGMHLSHFPLDMKIGRMVIYGALFGCLDPVMTVAASIGQEQKLFLSPAGRQAEAANAHKKFAHECSDLLTLHNVYRAWHLQSVQGGARAETAFSRTNFVSQRSLEEIRKTKSELMQVLKRMGFASDEDSVDPVNVERLDLNYKGTSDWLNRYADNVPLVCAVLCAGLFPNVAMVTHKPNSKRNREVAYTCRNPRNNQDEIVTLIDRSVNAGRLRPGVKQDFRGPQRVGWVTFLTKLKTNSRVLLFDSTFVPHAALSFFGGSVQIQYRDRALVVDRWCRLVVPPKTAVIIQKYRRALDEFLLRKFDAPSAKQQEEDLRVVDMIVRLLKFED